MSDRCRKRKSSLLNALSPADLTLDLLAGPAGCLNGSGLEFAILTGVLDHLGEPICTVVGSEFSVREGISKVAEEISIIPRDQTINSPNNTHGGSHQGIASVLV